MKSTTQDPQNDYNRLLIAATAKVKALKNDPGNKLAAERALKELLDHVLMAKEFHGLPPEFIGVKPEDCRKLPEEFVKLVLSAQLTSCCQERLDYYIVGVIAANSGIYETDVQWPNFCAEPSKTPVVYIYRRP